MREQEVRTDLQQNPQDEQAWNAARAGSLPACHQDREPDVDRVHEGDHEQSDVRAGRRAIERSEARRPQNAERRACDNERVEARPQVQL